MSDPPPTKRCRKCRETKPIDEFARNGPRRRNNCKECLRGQVADIRHVQKQEGEPRVSAFILERDRYGYVVRQIAIPARCVEEITVRVDSPNIMPIALRRLEQRMVASANAKR